MGLTSKALSAVYSTIIEVNNSQVDSFEQGGSVTYDVDISTSATPNPAVSNVELDSDIQVAAGAAPHRVVRPYGTNHGDQYHYEVSFGNTSGASYGSGQVVLEDGNGNELATETNLWGAGDVWLMEVDVAPGTEVYVDNDYDGEATVRFMRVEPSADITSDYTVNGVTQE